MTLITSRASCDAKNYVVSPTFYPNLPLFLHRYICHIRDISQLWQTYHNTLVFVSPKAVKVFNFSFQASKLWSSCDPGTSKQWFLPHSSKWIPISWGILVYIMFLLNDDWFQIFELKFLFCSCHGRQNEMFTFSLADLPKTTTDVYIWSLTELRSHKWFLCGHQDMFRFDCLTELWSHKYFYVDSKICLL